MFSYSVSFSSGPNKTVNSPHGRCGQFVAAAAIAATAAIAAASAPQLPKLRGDPDRPDAVPGGADPEAAAAGARLPDGAGAEETLPPQVSIDDLVIDDVEDENEE